jgi:hypothetical protein
MQVERDRQAERNKKTPVAPELVSRSLPGCPERLRARLLPMGVGCEFERPLGRAALQLAGAAANPSSPISWPALKDGKGSNTIRGGSAELVDKSYRVPPASGQKSLKPGTRSA